MRFLIVSLLLCLVFFAVLRAQEGDSAAFYNFGERLTLRPYFRGNIMALEVQNKEDFGNSSYRSNTPLTLGVGIWWRKFGIGFSIGIPKTELQNITPSQYFDFQYHYYGHYIVSDLYAMRCRGLYGHDEKGEVVFYPKSYLSRIGGRVAYPIQGSQYSYAAAFEQSELQMQTAFCYPVGVGLYYQSELAADPQMVVQPKNIYLAELYGGMAFVVPWRKHYFLAAEGLFGFTHTLNRRLATFNPSYSFEVRAAFGYTRRDWSLAFVFYYHTLGSGQSATQRYYLTTATGEVAFTYRIFQFYRAFRWVDWGNKLFGL